MGRRGPAPTPTNVLQLRGSGLVQKRKDEGEPQLEVARPRAPKRLTPGAKEIWADMVERVGPDGLRVMTQADVWALGRLCELQFLWNQSLAELYPDDSGRPLCDTVTEMGGIKEIPAVGRLLRIEEKLDRLYAKFGLTPADRVRVKALPSDDRPADDGGGSL